MFRMGKWCTVTTSDGEGKRYSLDVAADSSYDAAHLYVTHVKRNPACGYPIPTTSTTFEVSAEGKVLTVSGSRLKKWIERRRGMERPARLVVQPAARAWRLAVLKLRRFPADQIFVTDLERENAILRGALLFASREIQKLQFGRKDSPVLRKLREVLGDDVSHVGRQRSAGPLRVGGDPNRPFAPEAKTRLETAFNAHR